MELYCYLVSHQDACGCRAGGAEKKQRSADQKKDDVEGKREQLDKYALLLNRVWEVCLHIINLRSSIISVSLSFRCQQLKERALLLLISPGEACNLIA